MRAKRTAEQTEKKKQQEAQEANVLQNKKKLLSRWKKSQLILRLFRISLENYPVNEEEDKRIEVEQEELITSPFIEETPPIEEPKKKRGEKLLNR